MGEELTAAMSRVGEELVHSSTVLDSSQPAPAREWRHRASMAPTLGGTPAEPMRQRKLNRIYKISGCVVVVIVVMIAVPVYYHMRDTPPVTYPCHIDLSVPLLSPQFYSNGSVVDHGDVYPTGFYFTVNGTTRGCLCALNPCIRKCCAKDEYYKRKVGCKKNTKPSPFDKFRLPVYQSPWNITDVAKNHFRILYGDVCKVKFITQAHLPQPQLMTNGSIYRILSENESVYVNTSQYCLDSLDARDEITIMFCAATVRVSLETEDSVEYIMYSMYTVGTIISTFFLLATFLVYYILPELHNNLHGLSLMCHTAALLTGYSFHAAIKIFQEDLSSDLCILFAFTAQFSLLATFFWMNVMCIDIWLVISKVRPAQSRNYNKKFLYYSLYAWGVPMFIVGVSIAMDMIPGVPDTWIKPQFGKKKCWFADDRGLLLYFYLPIAAVVVTNVVTFVSAAIALRAHSQHTNMLNTSESRRTSDSDIDRFNLYLRLFIVMGVNWIMELFAVYVGGPKILWFIPNLVNTLQGVFIFIIFVCKRKTLKILNKKLCPQWNVMTDTSTNSSTSTTRTTSISSRSMYHSQDTVLKPLHGDIKDEY
ncbi:G-protein coupled receptor Mth2-like [Macrosteles quadrilineatus]|uniref:G-protein coupled receptor Mth2-like n=1 Tax=Macrosteles quadrilineatus TaxID=74068 RepID=UPI0023E21710|nr:G-protein coupled receptor Mth2-like [Macrosteles quadrilineatus]